MIDPPRSSLPSSEQPTPWTPQFNMGRSTTLENHPSLSNKYFPATDKRRLIPEENGVLQPSMYQYNRQQTGFQSSNTISNDKSFPSNMQSNLPNPMSTGNNSMNYSMYQRNVGGDSNIYPINNLDMSSQSKQGFNSSSRLSGMSQFLDSSNHPYLSSTPHRTISSGSMNPNVAMFNGQNMSKNRSGSYNFDSHSVSLINQWDTQIGNFDSSEFPSLKTKPSTLLSQMSTSGSSYNYNLPNKSITGQINYQMVTKSGMPIVPGEHTSEFSIQQEDFPALPVAQNPITCAAESQRSSSASGGVLNAAVATNSCDNSSQSHNSSIVDSNDFIVQKTYSNNFPDLQFSEQVSMIPPTSLISLSAPLSSTNNSSQPHSKVQKKISHGPNNFIANIPNDMVSDAFGLIGLVKLIGINDTYANLNLLAPGVETLSLNRELDSNKEIFHSYVSPLSSNCAGRPHDMDYPVPKEYRIRHMLLDRLADPSPEKLSDETLFWIFYNLCGEECQLIAARQLMNRQWRYNTRERFWLTRDPGGADPVTHPSFERGNYIVWDYEKARRVSKSLTVYYKDLYSVSSSLSTKLPFCYNNPLMKRSLAPLVANSQQQQYTSLTTTSTATAPCSKVGPFLLPQHLPPTFLDQTASTQVSSHVASSTSLTSSATTLVVTQPQ